MAGGFFRSIYIDSTPWQRFSFASRLELRQATHVWRKSYASRERSMFFLGGFRVGVPQYHRSSFSHGNETSLVLARASLPCSLVLVEQGASVRPQYFGNIMPCNRFIERIHGVLLNSRREGGVDATVEMMYRERSGHLSCGVDGAC